jgi:hypothetical protein
MLRFATFALVFSLLQCVCFCESFTIEPTCCDITDPVNGPPVPCDCTDLAIDESRIGDLSEFSHFAAFDKGFLSVKNLSSLTLGPKRVTEGATRTSLPILYSRLLL